MNQIVRLLLLGTISCWPLLAVADFDDGFAAYERGDYATAYGEWRPLAEQGNAEAQWYLGFMYVSGRGVPQDDAEAVKWFRKAAEQGYAPAQNNLGAMYALGRGVPQDDAEAVKWYRKAAEQGHAWAQDSLGDMYESGRGVPQEDAEAYAWFNIAAAQGNEKAEENKKLIAESMSRADIVTAQKLARVYWELYVLPFRN